MRLFLALLAAVAATAVFLPAGASASCAPPRPAQLLRHADAAFVGRLVDSRPDAWIFAVDRAVKGGLGTQVEVRRGPITSVSLTPEPGRQIGLVLDGDAATGWTSSDCAVLTPAQLTAAAADPDATCWAPRIRSVRFRAPDRVEVVLGGLDDPSTTVRVDWGDGTKAWSRVSGGGPRRTVVLRHAFRRSGRHRVRVTVSAQPVAACGTRAERAAAPALVVRT